MDNDSIKYSYSLDNYGTLTVYENDMVLCTISDVTEETAEDMMAEMVYEMRGVVLDEK